MIALARCSHHAEAANIAGALVAQPPKDEVIYVHSACGYALAAAAAAGDPTLAKTYMAKAIDCLQKAKERGWADGWTLKTETDLEAIKAKPHFKT